MNTTAEALSRLHEAAVGAASWEDALTAVAHATGAAHGQLIGIGPPRIRFNRVSCVDEAAIKEFARIDGPNPAHNFRAASDHNAGLQEIRHESHYAAADKQLTGGDAYRTFCERYDMPYGNHTTVSRDADGFVIFATLRSASDGISTPEQRALFAQLTPSIAHAVALDTALNGHGRKLMLGGLDAIGQAVALLDADGLCLAATDLCDQLLSAQNALHLHNGRLRCLDQRDQDQLHRCLALVLKGQQPRAHFLIRRAFASPLIASVHRFAPPDSLLGFQPAALVHLQDSASSSSGLHRWLRSMDLTESEVAIALKLKGGIARPHIAESRGTSLSTVRQQIKTIYQKLGVRRESELMALLNAPSIIMPHTE